MTSTQLVEFQGISHYGVLLQNCFSRACICFIRSLIPKTEAAQSEFSQLLQNVKKHNETNFWASFPLLAVGSFMRLITDFLYYERFVLPHSTYTEISGTIIWIGLHSLYCIV